MQLNLDKIKLDLCRQMAIVGMIEKSATKAKDIACVKWYSLFNQEDQRTADVEKQNCVTKRLVNYLANLRRRTI